MATGARPTPPGIPGLAEGAYVTSESIFALEQLPARLAVVGGGPLGCELAQAFCRLGSQVTIIQDEAKFLPREERDAAQILAQSMARDGVTIYLNTRVTGARVEGPITTLETENYQHPPPGRRRARPGQCRARGQHARPGPGGRGHRLRG